jgi:hypothetical protein
MIFGCKKSGSVDSTKQNNAQIIQRFKGNIQLSAQPVTNQLM